MIRYANNNNRTGPRTIATPPTGIQSRSSDQMRISSTRTKIASRFSLNSMLNAKVYGGGGCGCGK
ncbi:MAG: hypothetical protein WD512_12375 [Candidatus Paceibacterota bacterium]